MTNTNCLEGLRCPACGQADRLHITATTVCDVTDDGSESISDHEWDDDSWTTCPGCGHCGPLHDFRTGACDAATSGTTTGSRASR